MPKKRRSRGRSKGGKGRASYIQCDMCGKLVPRDKAKRVTRYVSPVDPLLFRELKAKGAIIPRQVVEKWYCVSCAVHRRVVKVRAKSERSFKSRER